MTEQEKIINKIRASAIETINKKLEEEKRKIEDKVNNELNDVERCLQYIQNKLVYKIIDKNLACREFILANENIFFEDYNTVPEYDWNKGIKFLDSRIKGEPLFKVNGHSYYDMRYIIRHYEETFNEYNKRLLKLREQFSTIESLANNLIKQEPLIKELIKKYKQVDIDESFLDTIW